MTEVAVRVRRVDFADPTDMQAFLDQLDAYARDPMGAGEALTETVRSRLAVDLARHPTVRGFLAEAGGEVVGFATCFVAYSTFRARPLLNIHDIAVLPAWRGRRVAGAILASIADHARAGGCCRLSLEVRQDNRQAMAVYRRFGFEPGACGLHMEKHLGRATEDA